MLKTYLYIPDDLNNQIIFLANSQKKSKAEIIRQALIRGVATAQKEKNTSAQTLLKLAEIGEKSTFKGPKDSSDRIDELLWGKDWSKDE